MSHHHLKAVGVALATACADKLVAGHRLANDHPEYCGMGLHFADGKFIYCEVFDGQMPSETQFKQLQTHGPAGQFHAFDDRMHFIGWLAHQTDLSLSGHELADLALHDNQRLTLLRLQEFVAK